MGRRSTRAVATVRLTVCATALLSLCLAGCGGSKEAVRDDDGTITKAGAEPVFDLVAGDCVQPRAGLELKGIKDLRAVPCAEPHSHEVYAVANYSGADVYPGPKSLEAFADAACYDAFEGYVGRQLPESVLHLTYLVPSFASWTNGDDRAVVCFAVSPSEPLTASVRASNR